LSYAGKTIDLSAAEVATLPHQSVTAVDGHDKKSHVYVGVPLRTLLARVGVPAGEKLRGPALRLVVIARARDGYGVAYALAEFDQAFSDRTILLVDRQDGQPLPPNIGPWRIVAPGDQRPARWARMITALEVVSVGN
jgi:DMSO/TMAO reductase YedYZ molybdopterin-dependent catalytic subunit